MALFSLTILAQLKRSMQQPCLRQRRTQKQRQLHLHNHQHVFLLHQLTVPPIQTHTRLQRHHAKLKPSSSTTSPQNIHTCSEIEIKLQREISVVRFALTFLKRSGLALVLETRKEINTILRQSKWDEDFQSTL